MIHLRLVMDSDGLILSQHCRSHTNAVHLIVTLNAIYSGIWRRLI